MAKSHEQEVLRWRAARDRSLRRPEGWLSLAGLAWLADGRNRVGSDPENEVVLPRGPALVGWIDVGADGASFDASPEADVLEDGDRVTSIPLADDRNGSPTRLSVGEVSFHLIERGGALAVRIRDPESPVRRSFRGMEYFPISARWLIVARFEPAGSPRTIDAPNILGGVETYAAPGALLFEVGGTAHRLEAFQEPRETDLFIVVGDATNGRETYAGGRYLYAKPPKADRTVVLDFNKAYNPPCVFTPYATCVLPLPQNRLPLRIDAGEKAYRPGPQATHRPRR